MAEGGSFVPKMQESVSVSSTEYLELWNFKWIAGLKVNQISGISNSRFVSNLENVQAE